LVVTARGSQGRSRLEIGEVYWVVTAAVDSLRTMIDSNAFILDKLQEGYWYRRERA